MEPTQAALVAGLLVLLLLLLVIRSVGRRREQRAAEALDAPGSEAAVVETEPEPEPEPELEVESELEVEAEPPAEPAIDVATADPEPAVETPQQAPVKGRRRLARRSRREQPAQEEPTVAESSVAVTESVDQAELRVLREQLRALEQVIEERDAIAPSAAVTKVEPNEQSPDYLRQVSLVVRALAEHTSADESPRRTFARVAAAVERLGVPNEIERPILPADNALSGSRSGAGLRPSHRADEQGTLDPVASPTTDVFSGLRALPVVDVPVMRVPTSAVSSPPPAALEPALPELSADQLAAAAAAWLDEPVAVVAEHGTARVSPDDADPLTRRPANSVLPVPPPTTPEPTVGRRRRQSRGSH